MAPQAGPSRWAITKFGKNAETLWRVVPAAIGAAVERQMDTHAASRLRTLQAFGGAWPARFEELVDRLQGLDGVEVVRPAGAAFELVVVNGHVLLPFRYADDLGTSHKDRRATRRLNKSVRELLAQYGAAPKWVTDELFPISKADGPGAKLLGDLRPDGMVLVFFAANAKAGLLSLGWGEATVVPSGDLDWGYTEMLPLPKPPAPLASRPIPVDGPRVTEGGRAPLPRFDEAPLPAPELAVRTTPIEMGSGESSDEIAAQG